jgi:hypothetical protein
LLAVRPCGATSISGGECFSFEAFEDAALAKVFIVDPGASSCLAFDLLRFVETGLCDIGSVLPVPMDQVGAARPHRPTLIEEVPRKMRDTAGGTPALPYDEATSSFSSPMTNHK